MGIQYKQSGLWVLCAKYQDKAYTNTATHTYIDSLGRECTAKQTLWAEYARKLIHSVLRKKDAA